MKIAEGYEKACEIAIQTIDKVQQPININKNDHEYLKKCAITALNSKVVSQCQDHLAEVAIKAILAVADLERGDVNFDHIKIVTKTGGSLSDTDFFNGIIIDKDFSHP